MKTWVQVQVSISALALALVILTSQAGAQTLAPAIGTTTNLNAPITNPGTLGAPSMVTTNSFFSSSFQNRNGVQIASTTNVPTGIPPENQMGAPSMMQTNPFFGRSFQSTTNVAFGVPPAGTRTPTNLSFVNSNPNQNNLGGVPPMPSTATNPTSMTTSPYPGSASPSQGVAGAQSNAIPVTNFLFASSVRSLIGRGRGLFAAATNGYNIRLTQFAPNNLQFNILPASFGATNNWLLQFSATNDFFSAGIYSNAVYAGGNPYSAGLVFAGTASAVNTTTANAGSFFNVLEATYSGNQIVSFAADFIQLDNNDDPDSWNEGSIRYNSTIPDTVNLLMAPIAISFEQGGNAVLTWSTNLAGFQLEYTTNMPARAGAWSTNDAVPTIVDGQYTIIVTNAVSTGTRLYRLMKPL